MGQLTLFAPEHPAPQSRISVIPPFGPIQPVGPIRPATRVEGVPELVSALEKIVRRGFPEVVGTAREPRVRVQWNRRLRSTVARAVFTPPIACVEVSPSYHDAHPEELPETLAHEYAHVLHPNAGHGPKWRAELRAALDLLDLPARPNLACAAHLPPGHHRYEWRCRKCGSVVALRSRRRRDEVGSFSTCCGVGVDVYDLHTACPVEPRPFRVGCRRCDAVYVAYDEMDRGRRFARRHRCNCGGRLHAWEHWV